MTKRSFEPRGLPGYKCEFEPSLGKSGLWLVYEPPSDDNPLNAQITSRATAKAAVAAAHAHEKWKQENVR
jgi:hypothetical protein